jgi:hypothetical protein
MPRPQQLKRISRALSPASDPRGQRLPASRPAVILRLVRAGRYRSTIRGGEWRAAVPGHRAGAAEQSGRSAGGGNGGQPPERSPDYHRPFSPSVLPWHRPVASTPNSGRFDRTANLPAPPQRVTYARERERPPQAKTRPPRGHGAELRVSGQAPRRCSTAQEHNPLRKNRSSTAYGAPKNCVLPSFG